MLLRKEYSCIFAKDSDKTGKLNYMYFDSSDNFTIEATSPGRPSPPRVHHIQRDTM